MSQVPNAAPIQLRGVFVHYGGSAALVDVDLVVREGERVGVLGSSGAGKSTLLRLVNGSVRPSEGSVRVLGTDLASASPRQLREIRTRIGMVAQGLDLPGPLRVRHSVYAGRLGALGTTRGLMSLLSRRVDPLVSEALACVDLDGFANRRTDELSGGEQQRVAVARVLVQRPAVVLGDEPSSSLDPELAAVIASALTGVARLPWQGATPARAVVLSLHNPSLAREHCDRVIGLVRGRIAVDVAAHELADSHLNLIYSGGGR